MNASDTIDDAWSCPSQSICPALLFPVAILGRVSKLSRLLHKEIRAADMLINGRPDWWLSHLDERPPQRDPRSAAPWLHRRGEERSGASKSQGHLRARVVMLHIKSKQEKIRTTCRLLIRNIEGIPQFYKSLSSISMELFSAIQSNTRFINRIPSETVQMPPIISWKTPLKACRERQLTVIPLRAASSKLSLTLDRRAICGDLTLNTAWRCLDGTVITLVICWSAAKRSHGSAGRQSCRVG